MQKAWPCWMSKTLFVFFLYSDMKRLTLDVIASVVYSYDSDVFNEEDNVFLQKLIDLFKADFQQTNFQTKLRMLMIGKCMQLYAEDDFQLNLTC